MTGNCQAFLTMIAHSEGTDRAADPYRCCYGFKHTIADLSEHPAVTGEWLGESLANLGPRYAGEVSTAAGRYQINKHWWERARSACGFPNFSAESQDAAALWFIDCALATAHIERGEIAAAIARCRSTWASLPGGSSGQPQRSQASLVACYQQAGGTLAA